MSDYRPEFFGGNQAAAAFAADLCFVAHLWDDLIDADKPVSKDQINRVFSTCLCSIPSNPFYQAHQATLSPLIYAGVLGYIAANQMEASGNSHQIEIAHGLRYAVANVLAVCVALTNTPDKTAELLPQAWVWWMPERFADYAKEHNYAE